MRWWLYPLLAGAAMAAEVTSFERTVQPFVAKNCIGCHNSKLKSGELNLEPYRTQDAAMKDRETWERVAEKIRTGEMPPKGLPRPAMSEIRTVTGWLEREFERMDRAAAPDPGRVTARRLNRFEYNNTVRDLTGVNYRPGDEFPPDDSGYGFDNIGDVLSVSPVLMEKYMAAAEKIARMAVRAEPITFRATRVRMEGEKLRSQAVLDAKQAGPKSTNTALFAQHNFPADGDYEVRLTLGGLRPDGLPAIAMPFWVDGKLQETFAVDPARNKKRNFDIPLRLTAGVHQLGAAFAKDNFDPAANPIAPRDRYLAIEGIEIRGPFNAVEPPLPESHRRIIICGHARGEHHADCARQIVSAFARKAYRRPVRDSEINALLRFVDMARSDGDSLEHGVRLAVQAALISPHFLFRIERHTAADPKAVQPVNDHELASRLSYFLWSTMPDAELSALADAGKLRQPEVMAAQLKRMLQDPKADALAANFAGQWLELRNLETVKPDPDKFPQFDNELRRAMRTETEMFFAAMMREDRNILDFLDARFTFLNERLARHYGIEGVEGRAFRRVELNTDQRGGVLAHASVLTVSSYPTRTSPVIRGKWVLENLLASPPPPPPPNVPNLDEAAAGNTGTLRQQLEKHRTNAICASCHARMDPLGFGLENYDAIGAWRTMDGKFPIDAAGTLPNGAVFRTPAELRKILRGDQDAFVRCLTEKLLTYALGRGLERYDKPAVNSISRNLAAGNYRFSRLVTEIVNSMPFQMRRGEATKTAEAGH